MCIKWLRKKGNFMDILDELKKAGGKEWQKTIGSNQLHRIYLNEDAVINFLSLKTLTDFEMKCLKKAKTYYDVLTKKIISDIGTVRVLFNQNGVKCSKD